MNPASALPHVTTLHRLRRHRFLEFRRPRGLCLRAERGTLWVTVDGDPLDIELNPGERRVFDGTATVIVGALGGDALASVTRPAATTWAERLRGLRERLAAGLPRGLRSPPLRLHL